MDRARRTTASRRRPHGASTSPQSLSEASFDHQSSASPVLAHATNTPQTAPQGRRANKSLQQSFTSSTPGPHRPLNLRKRSKTMDDYAVADDDYENGSPKKGGHSLRKRARVDYTFEQIDDEVEVPNSTAASSSRHKKRRPDSSFDAEDSLGPGLKRRGASVEADTPSSRRRNPGRKPSEMPAYKEDVDEDENEVQDTIEVGVSFSDSEKPDGPRCGASNTLSTDQPREAPQNARPAAQSQPGNVNASRSADSLAEAASEKSPDSPVHKMAAAEPVAELAPQSPNGATATVPKASAEPQPEIEEDDASSISIEAHLPGHRVSGPLHLHNTALPLSEKQEAREPGLPPLSAAAAAAADQSALTAQGDDDPDEQHGPAKTHLEPSGRLLGEEANHEEPEIIDGEDEASQLQGPLLPSQQSAPSDASPALAASVKLDDMHCRKASQDEDVKSASLDTPESQSSASTLEPTVSSASQATSAETNLTKPASVTGDEAIPSPTVQVLDKQTKPASPTRPEQPAQAAASANPQPRPVGRWSYLSPYLDGEYVLYPEKKCQLEDDAGAGDDQTTEDKDAEREANEMEPMVDDNDDNPDAAAVEAPTTALNTPTRGSPVPESTDPTAANSPAPGGEDPDEVDVSESQEPLERRRRFRYRKLRDPEEYISAIEKYEDMSTADLYELLDSINLSLVQWQKEWNGLGRIVDDYENSLRRRAADVKYESRTRNFHQHGINYEEPDFVVKGYKSKEKEIMNETRYLQGQDRIMAAAYGFEHDPHPSKIGRQNPESQQVGIMTRGRSLRNQPKPTAKATEADEVTGKRQRKPVQLFDPAAQDVSRSSTPVPARGRRRRNANADNDDSQPTATSSFNGEPTSDGEGTEAKTRRKRGTRPKMPVPSIVEDLAPAPAEEPSARETPSRSGRRSRAKQPATKYEDDAFPFQFVGEEPRSEPRQPRRRHLLTLKIPKSKNFSEPSSAITDNGDSRPSTASSDSSSHTAESSYSFRPKRQKRFRDDPDDSEEAGLAPPKKRNKRGNLYAAAAEELAAPTEQAAPDAPQQNVSRKVHKIKVVRTTPANRIGTPSSLPNGDEGDDTPKDYKSMTKSEKMSASMKSRWANGNMAGAVEKRKATLAAKKAAQATAEQRVGLIAPKPKTKSAKKDAMEPGSALAFSPQIIPAMGFPFPAS